MNFQHSMRSAIALLLFVSLEAPAQVPGTRYRDLIFASASSTLNIQYGSNVKIGGSNATLLLDFYEPTGDTLTSRPLIIFIHGGSLVVGDKTELGSLSMDVAKRGYVAASIDYRLGVELPENEKTIAEALLRGVQDTKAAVRFFRENAAVYGIDTAHIFLAGSSAGSMIALHYAYWDEDEIPPDVNQTAWGDIEGTSGHPGFSTDVSGIVSYSGAILDPSWIDADEPPVGNFHGLMDQVVPPDSAVSSEFGIVLFGGVRVSRVATELGIYNHAAIFPDMGHGGNVDSLTTFEAHFFYSVLMLSSAVPGDFTAMDLPVESLSLFRYDTYTFWTTAVDTNGKRITVPQSMVQYACDAAVGTIAPTGIFTPSNHPDSGYVYATFNGVTDSCFVSTYDFAFFKLRPQLAVIDTLRTLQLHIDTFDADSVKHALAVTRFTLSSTDPTVGTVDPTGLFTGKKNGMTLVVASFGGYSDTCEIRVENAQGFVSLDALESLAGWTISGTNLDSVSLSLESSQHSEGAASFKVFYKVTYNPALTPYMLYLEKDILLYGLPDTIYLDARTDGRRHRLYYRFSDAESGFFRGIGRKFLNDSVAFLNVDAPMAGLSQLSEVVSETYPLTLRRIEIQLAPVTTTGVVTSGTLYLDNLRVRYPGSLTGVEESPVTPAGFRLDQNFPNPFNPSTTLRYTLPSRTLVTLSVYNVLGQKVAELVHGEQESGVYNVHFDASGLASGMYVYRLQAGMVQQTRRLVVVK